MHACNQGESQPDHINDGNIEMNTILILYFTSNE